MAAAAKILIVDDEIPLLEANARLLSQNGYDVYTASTGMAGFAQAKKILPELILLDVILPDANGVEICRKIKKDPILGHVFVVLLSSAKTRSFDQADGLEAGADGYIARPISNREMLSRINTMIRIKQTESELRLQKEWLQVTLTSAGDGVIATDKSGLISFINPVAERVTGWGNTEAIGQPIEKILVFDADREFQNPIRQVLKNGSPFYLDSYAILKNKKGKHIPIADSAAPIRDEQGDILGVVMLFQDITEKINTEKKLEKRLEELTALSSLTDRLNECFTAQEVQEQAFDFLKKVIQPDAIFLFFRSDGKLLLKNIFETTPKVNLRNLAVHNIGDCLCGLAASGNNSQYALNIHTDKRCTLWECIDANYTSFAALPLISRNETIGVLGFASTAPRDFSAEAAFIEMLVDQISPRLQLTLLYDELEERIAERTAELSNLVALMSGREVRMAELKKVIRTLREQIESAGLQPVADDPLLGDT